MRKILKKFFVLSLILTTVLSFSGCFGGIKALKEIGEAVNGGKNQGSSDIPDDWYDDEPWDSLVYWQNESGDYSNSEGDIFTPDYIKGFSEKDSNSNSNADSNSQDSNLNENQKGTWILEGSYVTIPEDYDDGDYSYRFSYWEEDDGEVFFSRCGGYYHSYRYDYSDQYFSCTAPPEAIPDEGFVTLDISYWTENVELDTDNCRYYFTTKCWADIAESGLSNRYASPEEYFVYNDGDEEENNVYFTESEIIHAGPISKSVTVYANMPGEYKKGDYMSIYFTAHHDNSGRQMVYEWRYIFQ